MGRAPRLARFFAICLVFQRTRRFGFWAGAFRIYAAGNIEALTHLYLVNSVRQYDISVGHLTLEHNYPRSKAEPSTVSVDVNAILEDLTAEVLRVGSWVNVLGYVRDSTSPALSFSSSQLDSQESNGAVSTTLPAKVPSRPVYVDAVMVFPAGAIALGEYERILRNSQDVERRLRHRD